jgi:phospholipase C
MGSSLTRREVLQAGIAAGAVALGSADPLVGQAIAAKPPKEAKLSDIEHVVILIQENRSFDHYFGMLPGVRGFSDEAAHSVFFQPGYPEPGYEGELLPFHLNTKGAPQCFPDITHSWKPQHESWDGGAMDGFVETHLKADGKAAGPATMGYYEQADIPYYYALANAFTICDGYYCSVLGPTDPNRLYSLSATLDPEGKNGGPLIQTLDNKKPLAGTFTWTTMPEQLQSAGISWKVYSGVGGASADNELSYFKNFQTNAELQARAFKPVYPNDFKADIEKDELPQVSWINTSLDQTEHPGLSTARVGEKAVEQLVKLLVKHKRVWQKTALFITWDENGGFFDHVAPPTPPPGTPGEYLTVEDVTKNSGGVTGPVGLGFRVPLLIVSPFSKGGFCSSDTFDHTSLLRFMESRWGVEVPNLSEWRRETTGDLTSAFNFKGADYSKPSLPKVAISHKQLEAGGCETSSPVTVPPNSFPEQPAGTRPKPSGL